MDRWTSGGGSPFPGQGRGPGKPFPEAGRSVGCSAYERRLGLNSWFQSKTN